MAKTRLALFASGSGSNAINIIDHFMGHPTIEVVFLLTNKKDAPVVDKCHLRSIDTVILSNDSVSQANVLLDICKEKEIDYIILAGYLRLIPKEFIHHYHERIINIHPSLLPKFGGKGMYGDHVHCAVIEEKESVSGISIHFVDEQFDCGRIIAQLYCKVEADDTTASLKKKVQHLEHTYFPLVIEKTILSEEYA